MLQILALDRKYIAYTYGLKKYLLKFLFNRKPFPLQFDGATFLVEPGSSDLYTIYEICYDLGYQPRQAQPPYRFRTVVDFGANIGVFSVWAAQAFHPETLFAVEMEPACFRQLTANIKLNGLDSVIRPIQAAIYESSGKVATQRRMGYNFHELSPHGGHHLVRSFSFADFLQHTGLQTIDLLKIDIEGAEKYILTSENACLFKERVKYIILETHSNNGFNTSHCVTYLRDLGFKLVLTPTPYVIDKNFIIDALNPALN
jgi:FkbM family methyltransferase